MGKPVTLVAVSDVPTLSSTAHKGKTINKQAEHPAYSARTRIELGQKHAVQAARPTDATEILEALVKLGQLVHGLVAHECFADKQNLVGTVDGDELGKRTHQRLVVLHAACRIDQHDVEAGLACIGKGLLRNAGRILAVPLFIQLDLVVPLRRAIAHALAIDVQLRQVAYMDAQLFHGAASKRVAGGNKDAKAVLQ